jgi:hypothetical protein
MAEALTADAMPVPHGFFTRRGGVSSGSYASLNCSLSSLDDRDNVLENRARVARSLDTDPVRLLGLTQVHGTRVVTAIEPWQAGQGELADAMVTDRPGLALGIVTAGAVRRLEWENRRRRPCRLARSRGRCVGGYHHGDDGFGCTGRAHHRRDRPVHRPGVL